MILFIILVVLLILVVICCKHTEDKYDGLLLCMLSIIFIMVFGGINLAFLISNLYTLSPLGRKTLQIKYEELSKNKYNDYLIEDIVEWNKDIKFGKEFQHDKWIGIYVPNIYDDFEEIDVNN